MKATSANIVLVNEEGETVANFIMKRLNVKSAIRRQGMFELIKEDDETIRGQIFSAASVACSLHDEKGELVYPQDKYPDLSAVDAIFEMDYEIYSAIAKAHNEVNPVTSLSAKKKKS